MPKKFNFLAPRTEQQRAEAELQRKYPKKPAGWIKAKASQSASGRDITHELRAPDRVEKGLR